MRNRVLEVRRLRFLGGGAQRVINSTVMTVTVTVVEVPQRELP